MRRQFLPVWTGVILIVVGTLGRGDLVVHSAMAQGESSRAIFDDGPYGRQLGKSVLKFDVGQGGNEIEIPEEVAEITRVTDLMGNTLPWKTLYAAESTVRRLSWEGSEPIDNRQSLIVETAKASGQFADGRIVFLANDAAVEGNSIRLETSPKHHRIGFWTDASASVSWPFKATRWGMYDVCMTYAAATGCNSTIKVRIAEETLQHQLVPTGDWYSYRTVKLGTIYLAAAGDFSVDVRCLEMPGPAVMNLKAITLVPACEGAAPVQAANGEILLHSKDSIVRGTNLRYEPNPVKITLGYWTKVEDAAVWQFTVTEPGRFEIEVMQGCGRGHGGSQVAVECLGETWEFTVEDTGHFQNFIPRVIGELEIEKAGQYELKIQPRTIVNVAALDVRQIRLIPKP